MMVTVVQFVFAFLNFLTIDETHEGAQKRCEKSTDLIYYKTELRVGINDLLTVVVHRFSTSIVQVGESQENTKRRRRADFNDIVITPFFSLYCVEKKENR